MGWDRKSGCPGTGSNGGLSFLRMIRPRSLPAAADDPSRQKM